MAKQGSQFRFLLLLMLLAGVGYVAWPYVGGRVKKQGSAVEQIQKLGGKIVYAHEYDKTGRGRPVAKPPSLKEELLGAEMVDDIVVLQLNGTEVTDQQLGEILVNLPNVEYLSLNNTTIGDAGTAALATLKRLKSLSLVDTGVTDATLKNIQLCAELESLQLTRTGITDAGLADLIGLTELKRLWIDGTAVTDAGLETLSGLPKLERVYVKGSKVTPAGIEKLKSKMPRLTID